MTTQMILAYLVTGALAGTMSGLLGLGGGIVVVPALAALFLQNAMIPDALYMKMAIGTSLAIMVVTLASSVKAHHRRQFVHWKMVKKVFPGLMIGSIIGVILVRFLPSSYLSIIFGLFLLIISAYLLVKKPTTETVTDIAPMQNSPLFLSILASFIGVFSSLLGAGGGTMWVPFFLYCKLTMHEAIGTSVACGIVGAMIATLSYLISGFFSAELIPWSTSYIYWPAFLGVAATSVFFAPFGAALADRLSQAWLKKIFAICILLIAVDMLFFAK